MSNLAFAFEEGPLILPSQGRGRPSQATKAQYERDLKAFADRINQITSGINFAVSVRGLCYLLEAHGLSKDDFDKAQKVLVKCRKLGLLPLDIVVEESRGIDGIIYAGLWTPEEYAQKEINTLFGIAKDYNRANLWANQEYFPVMMVEKIDLKTLFADHCADYQVPIVSAKGWPSITLLGKLAAMFKEAEGRGQIPVILYCGDFDPTGLQISDNMKRAFEDLSLATGWGAETLEVRRFGLNYEFIEENGLTWIDFVPPSAKASAKHEDDEDEPTVDPRHIQEYLEKYGPRKCEANALVIRPEEARKLCWSAIHDLIEWDALDEYRAGEIEAKAQVTAIIESTVHLPEGWDRTL